MINIDPSLRTVTIFLTIFYFESLTEIDSSIDITQGSSNLVLDQSQTVSEGILPVIIFKRGKILLQLIKRDLFGSAKLQIFQM